MSYPRGYKLFEPLDHLNPNPSLDHLIKTFNEGTDYLVADTSIIFTETTANSTYLNNGATEYRYFVAFDDENIGSPSSVFSLINLLPPTNLTLSTTDSDMISISFTNAQYASGYKYSAKNLTTNGIIEGTLSVDRNIIGLSADTNYEIKIASLNDLNEQTEWSNTASAKTLTLFVLTPAVSNQRISWSWDYQTTGNENRYELIDADALSVLYSGLNKTYVIASSPTKKYNAYVRVINNDGSERSTRTMQSLVYTDNKISFKVSQGLTTAGKFLANTFFTIFHDSAYQSDFKNTIFNDNKNVYRNDITFYSDLKTYGLMNWSLNNWRNDNLLFKMGSDAVGSFKISSKEEIVRNFANQLQYKVTFGTNGVSNNAFQRALFNDKTEKVYSKEAHGQFTSFIVKTNSTTYADYKDYLKPQFYIQNSRTVQYGLKLGIFNDRANCVGRGRQMLFNPTTPFDVENKDIVYSLVTTNVDIESKVNKVRILCLGDSITAGAPLYDPNYGGTVFMPDLLTGKVKTRNVIESEYPYWLQYRLGIDEFEVINEGSGRRTSAEVLYHVQEQLNEYKPQFVIVMIGTNDIFAAQDRGAAKLQDTVNSTLFNIRQTVDAIIAANATPILGTQLPRNSIVPLEAKNALRNLNAGIKNLGIEKVMDVVDWYEVFVQHDKNGVENGVLRYDLTGDDTHPTVEGYKTMAYSINLGIFNSFRANLRVFGKMKGEDVDYSSEEARSQPDPYTFNYTLSYPQMRRLQSYVYNKYIKNTGNSWGMFTLEMSDPEGIVLVWDAKEGMWSSGFTGQLAPNQIMELKMKFTMPSTGTTKRVDMNIDYLVKK